MPTSQVFNLDCLEYLKSVPDKFFELAIVDPPYGINITKWDSIDSKPNREYFEELFRVSKNQIVWGANYFHLPHSEAWICWDKTMKNGKMALGKGIKSEFELAWTNTDNKATMIHLTHDGNIQGFNGGSVDYAYKSIHPTQKPVALYRWLLENYAKQGDKILDTHMGSQSSRIACFDMGFDFIGCELDKDYFDAGNKRFELFKSQTKLF